ncbi:MAG: D-alanyl-D-alanine carboxypeptidase/D-alanyl-D-alanine-endopeptidase [Phycisphaerae bacterium]|nr:D-alanyl-D-alanine carboxypeptidase/D-alanyl-D-alanine-endopeptidase [Phycisphaerae bacterium]
MSKLQTSIRRRSTSLLLILAATLIIPPGGATAAALSRAQTVEKLHRLLANLPQKQVACSAKVVDLTAGEVVLERNASRKLIPASNQKLWVLAAATVGLGESFAFRTVLAANGQNVYVIGDGDPGFGDPRLVEAREDSVIGELERWAEVLVRKGFKSLAGRLIFDDSLFDRQWTHPSWEPRHRQKWYAAPVSALIINDNCIDVTLQPAKNTGAPVLWSMMPPNDAVEIVNRCKSGGKGKPVINRPEQQMRFVLSGRCNKRWEFPSVAVADPAALFAGAFHRVLRDRGIATDGEVRTERVRLPTGLLPSNLTVLAEYQTPLPEVLSRIGKNSQNLFAEALLKRLGYEWSRRAGWESPIGSWDTGRSAMLNFAQSAQVPLDESDYHDASGLSRANRMSADQAVGLLSAMFRHRARDLFVGSLAMVGQDGSLKKRMVSLPGAVYAKTGYLNGVRTLSGYVITPAGRWFAFSVLFNDIKGGAKRFNKVHDQFCELLANWPDA